MTKSAGKTRARRARFVVGFDSEDDGAGHPFLWCFTHGEGNYYTRARHDAIMFLANLTTAKAARGVTVEAWATNLEYDLLNLFEPEHIPQVFLRFGRSALCGARWRKCEFRDTIRHVPASVEQWGELLGIQKLETRLFARRRRSFASYLRRCQRDSQITYHAAKRLHATYGVLGTFPRMTLASTALAIWQASYRRELRRPSRRVWRAAREAYHGGRTQAFAVGEFTNARAVDVASMFPWAMVDRTLPVPWGLHTLEGPGAAIHSHGLYRVQVDSRLRFPRLPVRTAKGTIFPNGRWIGWYVGEELEAFQRVGGKLRVLNGIRFHEHCHPFRRYVRAMFARKQKARGVSRLLFKLLLNALYGKFGQGGRLVRAIPLARFMSLPRRPLTWREWNGLVIYTDENVPPVWGNMVWPAFVTARARVRLADELDTLAGRAARPLYCDTDSVIFTGGNGAVRYPKRVTVPGRFELRGRYRRVMILGKKEYAVELRRNHWEPHAKGVPYAERMRYLLDGAVMFQRPVRLRESARDGTRPNVWRSVTKQRRTDLRKQASKADGSLSTPWIVQGESPNVRK